MGVFDAAIYSMRESAADHFSGVLEWLADECETKLAEIRAAQAKEVAEGQLLSLSDWMGTPTDDDELAFWQQRAEELREAAQNVRDFDRLAIETLERL